MKKRYYILLSLAIGFMFAGALTWGGLAGTGGVTEAVQFKAIGTQIVPKLATTRVGIGSATGTDALTIIDATATSTIYLSSGGGTNFGGSIIFENRDGSGCTELYFTDSSIATTSITCPY